MNKCVSSVIGLAIGDAMGVPVEFIPREKLIENPVTSMLGYGSHNVPVGSWWSDGKLNSSDHISLTGNYLCKG